MCTYIVLVHTSSIYNLHLQNFESLYWHILWPIVCLLILQLDIKSFMISLMVCLLVLFLSVRSENLAWVCVTMHMFFLFSKPVPYLCRNVVHIDIFILNLFLFANVFFVNFYYVPIFRKLCSYMILVEACSIYCSIYGIYL